ncbi:recombinase family protein [Streptomyces aureocirculatus]|uniref:recombinase family protein n=1 Tax=Streptomyces aureocirculatus TaxID=67275 RepID=UPI0004C52418|nr:recombinase family protein [Streptomyces aureocirculatus]
MVGVDNSGQQGQRRPGIHRTEGELRRRRTLADAAAGVGPGGGDEPGARAAGIERFRCVIYLCGAARTNIAAPREECTQYAQAFGWEITEVIEEYAGLLPPHGRPGLGRAVERLTSGEAGAVLTAWRAMISPVPQEYDEVARQIEKAGGFLHVMDPVRSGKGAVL